MNLMKRNYLTVVLSAIAALTVSSAFAQTALVGVGVAPITNTPTLFNVNRSTGEATAIGPLGSATAQPFGLATSGGILYTFDGSTDTVRRIDPLTGAFTGPAINIGIGNLSGEGDIAFSLDGVTGYITTANRPGGPTTDISPSLYTFSLATGTSSLVGTTRDEIGPITVDGLAFNPANGLFYALTDADDRLYTLNATTGVLTGVGALGVSPNSGFGALTFNGGVLYAAINDSIFTVNPATGRATAIPPSGFGTDFGSVSGLATVAAVPEPASSIGLLALGLFGLGLVNRRARFGCGGLSETRS